MSDTIVVSSLTTLGITLSSATPDLVIKPQGRIYSTSNPVVADNVAYSTIVNAGYIFGIGTHEAIDVFGGMNNEITNTSHGILGGPGEVGVYAVHTAQETIANRGTLYGISTESNSNLVVFNAAGGVILSHIGAGFDGSQSLFNAGTIGSHTDYGQFSGSAFNQVAMIDNLRSGTIIGAMNGYAIRDAAYNISMTNDGFI